MDQVDHKEARTMATTLQVSAIRIEAPTAVAAFALEERLTRFHPVTIGRRGRWWVELTDDDDRLDEIEAAVEHWLRATGIGSTAVHVDGVSRTVHGEPAEESPLGTGYDGDAVLEHEP
jgi:hypothetical protein